MQNDKFIPQESKLKKYQLEFLNKIIVRQPLFGPILKAFNRERILNGRYTKRNDYWEFVGYNILGPILRHFSEWIIAQANKHDIKRVFFLARDGWIIKKAVDLILKSSQYNISTCYLFASRRCYSLPALASIEDSDFHFLFDGGRRHSVLTLFNKLGISKEKISPLVAKYFSNPEEIIDQPAHYRKLEALFMEAGNIIAEHAAEERKVLVTYFKKNGVYDEKIIIVDIGWHGSLQRAMKNKSSMAIGSGQAAPLQEIYDDAPRAVRLSVNVLRCYVELLLQLKQPSKAEHALRTALTSVWHNDLIDLYGQVDAADTERQLLFAEQQLQERTNDPVLLLALGRIANRANKEHKAKEYLEAASRIKALPDVHAELGHLLTKQGQFEKACEHFNKAIAE